MLSPCNNFIAGVGPIQGDVSSTELIPSCLVSLQVPDEHILSCPHIMLRWLSLRFASTGVDLNKSSVISAQLKHQGHMGWVGWRTEQVSWIRVPFVRIQIRLNQTFFPKSGYGSELFPDLIRSFSGSDPKKSGSGPAKKTRIRIQIQNRTVFQGERGHLNLTW